MKKTCHPDCSEAEWRDLRTYLRTVPIESAKILRLAVLAQDDIGFWKIAGASCRFEYGMNCREAMIAPKSAQGGAKIKSTCHPDWSEAEWRDLRTDFSTVRKQVRRSFDSLTLAQDDMDL